jgi:proline iminopeptidase
MTGRTLYPEIEPRQVMQFDVGDGHRIHVEECGVAAGAPVVFLHGGPGSGCKPYHRQFFDPGRWRIVLFDQRGAGRSTPAGATRANTTAHLIADIELIRARLGIERWLAFGGSWGATLALLYAQAHPSRVSGLVLRGTFLARRRDLEWFVGDGVRRVFPDAWEEFIGRVPEARGGDVVAACRDVMAGDDPAARERVARAWSDWAGRVVGFSLDSPEQAGSEEGAQPVIAKAAIEIHYAANGYFIDEDQIMRGLHRLPEVPVTLIHGRRDLTCMPESGWLLHRALPGSKLVWLHRAGHLAGEPDMTDALVAAAADMLEQL